MFQLKTLFLSASLMLLAACGEKYEVVTKQAPLPSPPPVLLQKVERPSYFPTETFVSPTPSSQKSGLSGTPNK